MCVTTHIGVNVMKRTQILVKEEQHDYLVQQAAVNDISISEVIRRLIDKKITETIARQSRGGIDMAESAVEGPAEYTDHDEVLYR
jgi:predicted CopG family antitoxin